MINKLSKIFLLDRVFRVQWYFGKYTEQDSKEVQSFFEKDITKQYIFLKK